MINKDMLGSSGKTDYETPWPLFNKLDQEFHFVIDVCASEANTKCRWFWTKRDDALSRPWPRASCFMNPPYGRVIKQWMEKAYGESLQGSVVVCLVPARTDTTWWHKFAMRGEIRFLRGRIKFTEKPAPFPSAVVVFNFQMTSSPMQLPLWAL